MVKNPPVKAGVPGDVSSISGSGRASGGGNGTHSNILAWRIPWTEVPGRLQSMGHKELDTTETVQQNK